MIYQIRCYTLGDRDAVSRYVKVWENHMSSLPRFGFTVHGVWTSVPEGHELLKAPQSGDGIPVPNVVSDQAQIWALVSAESREALAVNTAAYMNAPDGVLADMADIPLDELKLVSVETHELEPTVYSPLPA